MRQRKSYRGMVEDCRREMQTVMNDTHMSARGAVEWVVENYFAGMTENQTESLMLRVFIAAESIRTGEIKHETFEAISKIIEEGTVEKARADFSEEEYKLILSDLELIKSKLKTVPKAR